MAPDKAVREAAAALHAAIGKAEAAGFRVVFPRSAAGLGSIIVSQTAKAADPEPIPAQESAAEDGTAGRGRRRTAAE